MTDEAPFFNAWFHMDDGSIYLFGIGNSSPLAPKVLMYPEIAEVWERMIQSKYETQAGLASICCDTPDNVIWRAK